MLKPIKNKKQYEEALAKIHSLMQKELKHNSEKYNLLETLSILIEKYEEENYPIESPDPIEAIKYKLEVLGLKDSDLKNCLGYSSRVSEIMNKKRKLSLQMIRTIHRKLNIPLESLIKEY